MEVTRTEGEGLMMGSANLIGDIIQFRLNTAPADMQAMSDDIVLREGLYQLRDYCEQNKLSGHLMMGCLLAKVFCKNCTKLSNCQLFSTSLACLAKAKYKMRTRICGAAAGKCED